MNKFLGFLLFTALSLNVNAYCVDVSTIFDQLSESDLEIVNSFLPNAVGQGGEIIIKTHKNNMLDMIVYPDVIEGADGLSCSTFDVILKTGEFSSGLLCDNNGKWLLLKGDCL